MYPDAKMYMVEIKKKKTRLDCWHRCSHMSVKQSKPWHRHEHTGLYYWFTQRYTHILTTTPVCSVYTVGFRKSFTCLGLLLAACHVGEDYWHFPVLLHQAQTIVPVISLPIVFVHFSPRHTRDTYSAAESVRVDPNWKGWGQESKLCPLETSFSH